MTQPYGHDPYRHQPPGYGPPPPHRKKSSAPTVLIILSVVALVFFGGCAVIIAAATYTPSTNTALEPAGTAADQAGRNGGDQAGTRSGDQAGTGEDDQPSQRPTGRRQPMRTGPAKIGDTVRDGAFAFTVTRLERRSRVGSEFIGADAQGVFLLVHITVKNVGDQAQAFTSAAQKLHADGKEYDADTGAAIYVENSRSLYEKINPGNSVRGVVLFDIPRT